MFTSQRYRDTRNGEIVTQVPISLIGHFDEYDGECQVGEYDHTPELEPKQEIGAASVLLELSDGQITVTHGSDHVKLGRTQTTKLGDWDRLIDFLKDELGVQWVVS